MSSRDPASRRPPRTAVNAPVMASGTHDGAPMSTALELALAACTAEEYCGAFLRSCIVTWLLACMRAAIGGSKCGPGICLPGG